MPRPEAPMVRPEAEPHWWALVRRLVDLADEEGRYPPCHGRDEWTDDSPKVRAQAAALCHGCPVLIECRDFADANRERWGVFAGTDRTILPRSRQRAA